MAQKRIPEEEPELEATAAVPMQTDETDDDVPLADLQASTARDAVSIAEVESIVAPLLKRRGKKRALDSGHQGERTKAYHLMLEGVKAIQDNQLTKVKDAALQYDNALRMQQAVIQMLTKGQITAEKVVETVKANTDLTARVNVLIQEVATLRQAFIQRTTEYENESKRVERLQKQLRDTEDICLKHRETIKTIASLTLEGPLP